MSIRSRLEMLEEGADELCSRLDKLETTLHYRHEWQCENCRTYAIVMIPRGMRAEDFPPTGSMYCKACGCERIKAKK